MTVTGEDLVFFFDVCELLAEQVHLPFEIDQLLVTGSCASFALLGTLFRRNDEHGTFFDVDFDVAFEALNQTVSHRCGLIGAGGELGGFLGAPVASLVVQVSVVRSQLACAPVMQRAAGELALGGVQEHEVLAWVDKRRARANIVVVVPRRPRLSLLSQRHGEISRKLPRLLFALLTGEDFIFICDVSKAVLRTAQLRVMLHQILLPHYQAALAAARPTVVSPLAVGFPHGVELGELVAPRCRLVHLLVHLARVFSDENVDRLLLLLRRMGMVMLKLLGSRC